ncbi:hypothetical protein GCM10022284_63850 [Streptomyces hundungensis]
MRGCWDVQLCDASANLHNARQTRPVTVTCRTSRLRDDAPWDARDVPGMPLKALKCRKSTAYQVFAGRRRLPSHGGTTKGACFLPAVESTDRGSRPELVGGARMKTFGSGRPVAIRSILSRRPT